MVYNEIMFLESMRFKKNDAIKNLEYVRKCYDSVIRSYDRGDLSLVNEYYFEIWNKVMRKTASVLSVEKLNNNLNFTQLAKSEVKDDKKLIDEFLKVSSIFKEIDDDRKKKVFSELVEKILNATFSDRMRIYREDNTSRGSRNKSNNLGLRQNLDALTSKKI